MVPDPHSICGSGSGPRRAGFFLKLKYAKEIAGNCNFIKCFKVIFLVSICFLLKLEKILCVFLVAGPDPDPHSGRLLDLDPDPYK